jgi:hypothetical protein
MNESKHSDDLSFFNDHDQNLLAPIATNQQFQKNPVFYQAKTQANKTTNKIVNVLTNNKITGKL